jgi:amino acid adenylation domain-containing protein
MSESDTRHGPARLTQAQQALLEKRLRDALAAASALRSVWRRPDPEQYPLSFAQERFWFLHQFEPDSAAYNRPAAFRLQGPLDVAVLERALSEIVRRHEVLRAIFPSIDGQPQQVILAPAAVQLPVVDLSALAEDQREMQAQELARKETLRPFRLSDSPPWRASLLRLAADRHILLVPTHHIASDGWSTGVLRHELATLYAAFAQGQPSPLQELPIQYADYAYWQRQSLRGEALDQQLSYWKRQLADLPASLDLPLDRPRPPVDTDHGHDARLRVPPALTAALQSFSKAHDVTLFMTLLAAFQTLLHRYSGQEDIVVGSPVAGRTMAETESLIGCFINTLVLRSDLSGNPTFRDLLGGVRASCLAAYAHSDLPFERLLAALNPARDLSRAPLFQVMFNSHLLPVSATEPASDLTLSEVSFDSGIAQFDLSVDISMISGPAAGYESTDGDELVCVFNYNTDLFDETTIQRMLGHYHTLLESIVSDPAQRVAFLPLLTPPEREQMLVVWNRTEQARPSQCLHQMFEQQAQRTPAALAVTLEGQSLTYAELNARANRLAHYLRRQGVGPEGIVAIGVRRSLDMAVGLLGILKAGGAYLPLDPDYPTERLVFLLKQSGARWLLTHEALSTITSGDATGGLQVVYLDSEWETIAGESCENPPNLTLPDNLAYVIYTSGSTGTPKGVMISHRAVCNHAAWYSEAFLRSDDRALQIAALTFDASVPEFFATYVAGAQVILAPPQAEMDPAGLVELIARQRVTIIVAVSTLLQALLEEPAFADCTDLRLILCGGEAMPAAQEAQVRSRTPAELYHGYGVTEATIDSTCWRCGPPHGQLTPPIGRPITNTQVYVLDRHLQPVPDGVTGEICLGGVGLARGYLGDTELTAAKFVPNPWGEAGTRLYRTGDLGRWRADANLEFLGRRDYQIKLHGFRIELGEIEARLREHSSVRQAVVVVHENLPAGRGLVAYVVPSSPQPPSASDLRSFLSARLPAYMVPSAFVTLPSFPTTASGKIDRRGLPLPSPDELPTSATFVPPRNATEETVAAIFRQTLGLSRVGVHDSFFELGGHSLQATQIIARVHRELGIRLSLRTLFGAPTVAGLAAAIAGAPAAQGPVLTPIPRSPRPTGGSTMPAKR